MTGQIVVKQPAPHRWTDAALKAERKNSALCEISLICIATYHEPQLERDRVTIT